VIGEKAHKTSAVSLARHRLAIPMCVFGKIKHFLENVRKNIM
jgi:hypothetical protein